MTQMTRINTVFEIEYVLRLEKFSYNISTKLYLGVYLHHPRHPRHPCHPCAILLIEESAAYIPVESGV
jgi:hypothetical protein